MKGPLHSASTLASFKARILEYYKIPGEIKIGPFCEGLVGAPEHGFALCW